MLIGVVVGHTTRTASWENVGKFREQGKGMYQNIFGGFLLSAGLTLWNVRRYVGCFVISKIVTSQTWFQDVSSHCMGGEREVLTKIACCCI